MWYAALFHQVPSMAEAVLKQAGQRRPIPLRGYTGHRPAFLGAIAASFSALLAMIHVVLSAFFRAGFTNFGTCVAKGGSMVPANGH